MTSLTGGKPTLILVPGAWFPPTVFDTLTTALCALDFTDVIIAPYPSFNPHDEHTASIADCAKDTAHIRETYLLPLVEEGKDVVLFAHSYGGMPAAGAATGLTKRARTQEGKTGGVIGLIMASAFVVAEGVSCAGSMGGAVAPWISTDNPSKHLNIPIDPDKIFFNDIPKATADNFISTILPCATLSFFSPQPKPVFSEPEFAGLCAYLKLTLDQAVPLAGQEAMMKYSGANWATQDLEQSHCSGFVVEEKARAMAEAVDSFVKGFVENA